VPLDLGIRDVLTGEAWTPAAPPPSGVVVQAGQDNVTPQGSTAHLLDVASQVIGSQALPILNPDPLTLELLFTHSHELGSIEQAIRRKVWRQGLRVVSRFAATCVACGAGVDQAGDACPKCGQAGTLREPDEAGKLVLERFLRQANLDQDTLADVGEDLTADGVRQGRFLLVLRNAYTLNPDGSVLTSRLQEVRRASPGTLRIVRGKNGRKGGKHFVCLACRSTPGYQPEATRRACRTCAGVTYDAWYAEVPSWGGGAPTQFYLPSEVYEAQLYYRDGTPPALRVWHKAWFFVFADYYARQAFDPRGDKRPDKLAAFIGVNADSVRKWLVEDRARRQKEPYSLGTVVLPAPELAGGTIRQDAKVLDFGDEVVKGQAIELRKAYQDDLRAQFGLTPIDAGDTTGGGGLNNEGLQMRVSSEIVEMLQRIHERWLDRVAAALGVHAWRYAFDHPFEEDDVREADVVQRQLDIAERAESLGLPVRWEDGRAVITDGPIQRKPQEFLGVPGIRDTFRSGPGGSVEQAEPHVGTRFGGPSPAVAAQDVLMDSFAGLTPDDALRVRQAIVETMSSPTWNVADLEARIRVILEDAGLPDAASRAGVIARTESAVLVSEHQIRQYRQQEAAQGREFVYRMTGARDHRRTKLSWWVEDQVGAGRPLDDVLRIIEDGIELAKEGAFVKGGSHYATRGQPIKLPAGFQRRGFIAHFNDRDTALRVVR
jgi:hypothetical protein